MSDLRTTENNLRKINSCNILQKQETKLQKKIIEHSVFKWNIYDCLTYAIILLIVLVSDMSQL